MSRTNAVLVGLLRFYSHKWHGKEDVCNLEDGDVDVSSKQQAMQHDSLLDDDKVVDEETSSEEDGEGWPGKSRVKGWDWPDIATVLGGIILLVWTPFTIADAYLGLTKPTF